MKLDHFEQFEKKRKDKKIKVVVNSLFLISAVGSAKSNSERPERGSTGYSPFSWSTVSHLINK